jgi:hypothetical protein
MAHGDDTRGRFHLVELDGFANNDGISTLSNTADGGFNVWGNSYPAEELPASGSIATFARVPFRFPRKDDGCANNVVCIGQTITFAEGEYCGMAILGAAERRSADVVTFLAAAGAEVRVPLRLSDWWPGARGHFGNRLALRCSRLHYPRHVQRDMSPALWVQRAAFPRIRTRQAVLPDHPALHIFGLTLTRTPA